MKVMVFEEKGKYSLKNAYDEVIRNVLIDGGKKLGATLVYEFSSGDVDKIGAIFDYIQECNEGKAKFDKKHLEDLLWQKKKNLKNI